MELDEAIRILEQRINSKSFRKAVGSSIVAAISELIRAARCRVCLDPGDAAEILNNAYILLSRVRRIAEMLEAADPELLRRLGSSLGFEGKRFAEALASELEAYLRFLEERLGGWRKVECGDRQQR